MRATDKSRGMEGHANCQGVLVELSTGLVILKIIIIIEITPPPPVCTEVEVVIERIRLIIIGCSYIYIMLLRFS